MSQYHDRDLVLARTEKKQLISDAYLALLRLPAISMVRANPAIQSAMSTLRDCIAEAEDRDAEDVQNEYEAKAAR